MEGFLDPNQVLKQLELREDMVVADFGSGSGGWTIPLAKKLTEGKIYALDILEEPLSALKSRAQLEKVFNIETILVDLEKNSKIRDDSIDLVLSINLLFQIEDKNAILKEIKRVLKKGGKALIIDWLTETALGPEEERVSAEKVKTLAKEIDLKLEKEFLAGSHHWALILLK